MAKKLKVQNERMLKLITWAVMAGKVNSESEFCDKIKYAKKNLFNIKNGHQSFTIEHVINACKFTGANANWILGMEPNMMRKPGKNAMELLREAVMAVEAEWSK